MTEQHIDTDKYQQALKDADCLYNKDSVEQAIAQMATDITAKLEATNPLILPVMVGGVVLAGKLLPLLPFPLQVDYIHATRYRSTTAGSELEWKKQPGKSLTDRTILLVDDILDEGITLAAIIDYCQQQGAKAIYTAVLADKQLNKKRPINKADFTGLEVPDLYVFGYGMDYEEYHRNVDGIYALRDS